MRIIPPDLNSMPTGTGILFAEDFDDMPDPHGHARAAAPMPTPVPAAPALTDEDVQTARHEGFMAGISAAKTESARIVQMAARDALLRLNDLLPALAEQRQRQIDEAVEVAARLVFTTLAALLPSLALRHAPQEIAHLLHDIIADLAPDRALTLAVSPGLLDAIRSALADLPREQARRVVLQGEDALAPGDARLGWEGGAAIRQTRPVLDAINDILRSLDLLAPTAPSTRPLVTLPDAAATPMETQHA